MEIYAFWNNKGGTGKTSLAFQSLCHFAHINQTARILAIDLCPQANMSELLLGGLVGHGGNNLCTLQNQSPRKTVGGYFESRLPAPFSPPQINVQNFLCHPNAFNTSVPSNVDLLAGDPVVELQSNAITTLANTQIPGIDTWLSVIDWIKDFIDSTNSAYDFVFIDSNPSFSVYTQIALSSATKLILPVMADDSSRRAIRNMFSLIHGINIPANAIYSQQSFSSKLSSAGRTPPLVHLILKNRLTQYMGAASAYSSVLKGIEDDVGSVFTQHPNAFSFQVLSDGFVEVRDFQTTGVVALAKGLPFYNLTPGNHDIMGRQVQVKSDYLDNCRNAIDSISSRL